MSIRILFVDEDEFVLDGLRCVIESHDPTWELEFADSGFAAIEMLKSKKFDVVCSEVQMPEMDGFELLEFVRREFPEIIRIVLTGAEGSQLMSKTFGPAHQSISKPCEPEILAGFLKRCVAVRQRIGNDAIRAMVSKFDKLPALPSNVGNLIAKLGDPDSSVQEIGQIIESDVALAVKVLQIVNSSFFGFNREIVSVQHAASILGKSRLKPIVLSASVFNEMSKGLSEGFDLHSFTERSMITGSVAYAIVEKETRDKELADQAMLSGLLHDVGHLLLASKFSEFHQTTHQLAASEQIPSWLAEQTSFGTTHGDIGGYLLCLWGFPFEIVESVVFHHQPSKANPENLQSLIPIHLAATWTETQFDSFECLNSQYDSNAINPIETEIFLNEMEETGIAAFSGCR